MQAGDEQRVSQVRFWIATIVTILVVIAVWLYIDYQMRPPPPPHPVQTPAVP